jgi:hypothetical protein
MATFSERMIGAAKLDAAVYEEVEHDSGAFGQAMGVVALASIASGVGSGLRGGIPDLAGNTIVTFAGWLLWAGISYVVGMKILPKPESHTTWGELLRTTGFSASPGILRVLGVLPFVGTLIFLVTAIWMLMAFVVAIRQALDYDSTWRATAVCFVGWLIYTVIGVLIF